MSRAPVESSSYSGQDKVFAEATAELNRQVDEGTPWSGNERNNFFLNLGKQQGDLKLPDFANIGGVTSFDLPDDSRAIITIDWDFDGDLDVLTTNRTAPRVRIFENRMPQANDSSVSLSLVGKTVNRDAIGSRVELELADGATLQRTMYAGQGFLSQSSKWLHFGLPQESEITAIRVHWNGGETEEFSGVTQGKFFMLEQGRGTATEWQATKVSMPTAQPAEFAGEKTATEVAHIERPVPMPEILYLDFDGNQQSITTDLKRPLLINLWATWCAPCVAELEEFAKQAAVFEEAGVDVVAICIDATPSDADSLAKARKILTDVQFPFAAGFAAEKTVELLHIVHNTVFIRPSKLPVPSSLLIAPGSKLASVTRGATTTQQLGEALSAIGGSPQEWLQFSQPAAGRWVHGADQISYSGIAKELLERGWLNEAERFLLDHHDSLEIERQKYPGMLMVTGTRMLEKGERRRGIALLEASVEQGPRVAAARNNLAVALLGAGRGAEAAKHLEVAIDCDPDFVDPKLNLAQFYVENLRPDDGLTLIDQVLESGYHPKAMRVKARVMIAKQDTKGLRSVFEDIAAQEPGDVGAWLNLGKLQLQTGDHAAALASFQKAARLDPNNQQIKEMISRLQP